MRQFERAIRILNEQFILVKKAIDEVIPVKRILLEEILQTESSSIYFLKIMKEFSKNKEVLANKDESSFMAVALKDYLLKHYLFRGMVIEIKNGNLVDQSILRDTIISLLTYHQIIPAIVSQIFFHIIYDKL